METGIVADKNLFEPQNEEEELFQVFANASNDMIHICSPDGRILFANRATERHLGYTVRELINTPSEKLIHPDDRETTMRNRKRLLGKGHLSPARDIRLVRKDGSHITANRAEMLLGCLGEKKYIGVLLRNTTILKTSARTLVSTNEKLQREIEDRKIIEARLIEKKAALQEKAISLEETNVALNVLLRKREKDQVAIEERIAANIEELVMPYLDRLMGTNLQENQKNLLAEVYASLRDVTSDFTLKLSSRYFNLSPTEIKVANQIKRGKRTKEIADLLNISTQTVKNHRHRIRVKIGIKKKKIGLAGYLSSLR